MDACDEMVICNAEMAARDVSLAPFALKWTKKSRASHRSSKPSGDAAVGKAGQFTRRRGKASESHPVSTRCFGCDAPA